MPLFKSMKVLTLNDLIVHENCKLMFRVHHKSAPLPIINLFPMMNHTYNTCRDSFSIPKHWLHKLNVSFMVRAIVDWDLVKKDVKEITNLKIF